ncbi:MarR family winged helix-turn-helix transcriptional regulator [Streptodolium elevatio]|uniref:MarR family transcriptional regulator n=1 Tax=Streptodolium elevatio TaxID=3157996 RepID=A0ABV3DGN7_9ACTN
MDRLFELAEVLGALMEEGITGHGLTRARAGLLWALMLHDGPMTQRALADALAVTPRNVTGLLDALQADGHITRAPHPTDRRATLVHLTDQGRAAVTHLRDGRDQMAAALFADIPADHLAGFHATIATIVTRLRGTELTPHADAAALCPTPQQPPQKR